MKTKEPKITITGNTITGPTVNFDSRTIEAMNNLALAAKANAEAIAAIAAMTRGVESVGIQIR